jgi:hypothetical protein
MVVHDEPWMVDLISAERRHIAVDDDPSATFPLLRRWILYSPRTRADQEPVNTNNWFEKMYAAVRARPGGWRNKFTPEELEIIEREMKPEIEWAQRAAIHDLPGPRRFDVFVD